MFLKKTFMSLLSTLIIFTLSRATILPVPGLHLTIQSAIDDAEPNDTVLIAPGVYIEQLTVIRPITLASNFLFTNDTSNIAQTTILFPDSLWSDSTRSRSVISLHNVHPFRLIGVTVRGGYGTPYSNARWHLAFFGGSMLAESSRVELINSRFTRGVAQQGGGLALISTNGLIKNCRIDSSAGYGIQKGGGGLWAYSDSLQIVSTLFYRNRHINYSGGGLFCMARRYGIIDSCSIIQNESIESSGGGSIHGFQSINNNLIQGNVSNHSAGLYLGNPEIQNTSILITVENNCIRENRAIYNSRVGLPGIGGGIDFFGDDSTQWIITGNEFIGNSATGLNGSPSSGASAEVQFGKALFKHNLFRNNVGGRGVAVLARQRVEINMDSNIFRENSGQSAIWMYIFTSCMIRNNDFYRNCEMAIETDDVLDASNNFWGDSTGPNVVPGNPNGQGDSLGQGILYTPWLLNPVFPENFVSPEHGSLPARSPQEFGLIEAYPNPFNATTTISFSLPKRDPNFRVIVSDLLSREVSTIYRGALPEGQHRFAWTPVELASGTYYISASGNSFPEKTIALHYLK